MRELVSVGAILVELETHNLLPTIIFRSSRAQCDYDVQRVTGNRKLHLDNSFQREIRAKITEVIEKYDIDRQLVISHPQYSALVTAGVGAHHAGQLLMWRLLLEELMSAGLLRALVATGTVAAGVDFPARTVIVTAHSRRGQDGFEDLTSAELQQMSGRAGRRGKDTVGFCIAVPSTFCDGRTVLKIAKRPPEPLKSSYFPGPSTVLNLLRYRTVDGLSYTVERSLASFVDRKEATILRTQAAKEQELLPERSDDEGKLDRANKQRVKRVRRLEREAESLGGRQIKMLESSLNGLRQLGYIEGEHLSNKGMWASNLCTSLVIELAEMIEAGLLNDVSIEVLVAIIASITGDSHRTYLRIKGGMLSEDIRTKLTTILDTLRDLSMPGVNSGLQVVDDAAFTVVSWLKTTTWQEFRLLLMAANVAEGDAARLITQTAEQLNQIARLSYSHKELANIALEARMILLRPPLTEVLSVQA